MLADFYGARLAGRFEFYSLNVIVPLFALGHVAYIWGMLNVASRLQLPQLHDKPVGDRGLIHGLGDDAIFAIDPADHSVRIAARHESIARAHDSYITRQSDLYYSSSATLIRYRIGK